MYKFSIDEKKNSFIVYLYKILTKFSFYYSNFYTVSSKSDINFLNSELGLGANKLFLRPNFIATKTFMLEVPSNFLSKDHSSRIHIQTNDLER